MASTSEKGHAKNLTNLDEIVFYASSFGEMFNPSKPTIKLAALTALSTSARNALNEVNNALGAYKLATDAREVAFNPLSKLSTRILNALKATDTTPQVVESANSFIRKIQGKRSTPKKTDEELAAAKAAGKETKEVSSSQMSFDSRLENFDKLIRLLSQIPQYTPNETDLKVETLTTLFNSLKSKNNAVMAAEAALSTARGARDTIFYTPKTGIVDIAADTKAYVKSVFGTSSVQFKQISGLQIRNIPV